MGQELLCYSEGSGTPALEERKHFNEFIQSIYFKIVKFKKFFTSLSQICSQTREPEFSIVQEVFGAEACPKIADVTMFPTFSTSYFNYSSKCMAGLR